MYDRSETSLKSFILKASKTLVQQQQHQWHRILCLLYVVCLYLLRSWYIMHSTYNVCIKFFFAILIIRFVYHRHRRCCVLRNFAKTNISEILRNRSNFVCYLSISIACFISCYLMQTTHNSHRWNAILRFVDHLVACLATQFSIERFGTIMSHKLRAQSIYFRLILNNVRKYIQTHGACKKSKSAISCLICFCIEKVNVQTFFVSFFFSSNRVYKFVTFNLSIFDSVN